MAQPAAQPHEPMPGLLWAFLFWGVLVGAPLAVVGLATAILMQQQIADVAALPSSGSPAAFEGALSRAGGPIRSPLGAQVVGWSGFVRSTVKSGKSSTQHTLCALGDVEAMSLDAVPLSLGQGAIAVDGAFSLLTEPRRHTASLMLMGEITEADAIPPSVAARCQLPPLAENESRAWVEHRFPEGATATFLGCRGRSGLLPCPTPLGQGGQLVTGTHRSLVERMLAGSMATGAGITLVSIFFSIVAGGYVRAWFRGWRP